MPLTRRDPLDGLPEDLRVCNCADPHCGVLLIGESDLPLWAALDLRDRQGLPRPVAGRIAGRPYCGPCLGTRRYDLHRGRDTRGQVPRDPPGTRED